MNKSIKYNQNSLPKFQYLNETDNLDIKGNVIKQTLYNRVSKICEIYAVEFPTLIPEVVRNIAIQPDTEETLNNTITLASLATQSTVFQPLAKYGALRVALSTVIGEKFAYINNISINDNPIDRFTAHKIAIVFFDSNFIYSIEECDTFLDRVKVVKYNYPENISEYEEHIIILKALYDNDDLTAETLNDLIVYNIGELTSYAALNINKDYNININGYSNDNGTFNNAKRVEIIQNFESSVENRESNIELSFYNNKLTNNAYHYTISNLYMIPDFIGISVDEYPNSTFILNRAELTAHSYKTGEMESSYFDTELNVVTINGKQYFDITDLFLGKFDIGEPIELIIEFENVKNTPIPELTTILFQFDKTGKVIERWVDENVKHQGSYNYDILRD